MPLFYYARQSSIATKEGAKLWHLSLKKVGRAIDCQMLAESNGLVRPLMKVTRVETVARLGMKMITRWDIERFA